MKLLLTGIAALSVLAAAAAHAGQRPHVIARQNTTSPMKAS